jgi:hypothetical protein
MIKINERFWFERDQHCWNLYEWKDGKNKDGEPMRSKTTTYHSRLEQICNEVIDRTAGDADGMQGVLLLINMASVDLKAAIDSMSTPPEAVVPSEYDNL